MYTWILDLLFSDAFSAALPAVRVRRPAFVNTTPITPPPPPSRRCHALCFVLLVLTFGVAEIATPPGTGAGVALSTVLGSELHAIVPVCLGLSAVHLGANFMSVRQLGVPTFDSQV